MNAPDPSRTYPPKKCGMPCLSRLQTQNSMGMLLSLFIGGGPTVPEAKSIWVNFISTVDAAIEEYEAARTMLLRFVNDGGLGRLFRCHSHLEFCILSVNRSLLLAMAMKQHPLFIDLKIQELGTLSRATRKIVKGFRDVIVHLDDRILTDTRGSKGPKSTFASNDSVFIGDQVIRFSDLAVWIEELHGISTAVVTHRP